MNRPEPLPTPTHDGPIAARRITLWVRRHPLLAYFGLTYALSWLAWIPWVLGNRDAVGAVLFIVGGFGPPASAAIVTRFTGGSVRTWARPIVHWRVAGRYYLYALGLPALLLAAVNLELALLGHGVDLDLLPRRLPAYLATLAFVAVLGGGLEEPGWRGFALPRLQAVRSPLTATLLLGFAWGVWHIPLYGPLGFAVPLVLAFFYTWLYNRTGSVLLCILLHASLSPAIDTLILLPNDGRGLVSVDVAIFGTLIAAAAILVGLTRGRLGHQASRQESGPSGGTE
jgi:membrane protease YdiL (CAAX protease family)